MATPSKIQWGPDVDLNDPLIKAIFYDRPEPVYVSSNSWSSDEESNEVEESTVNWQDFKESEEEKLRQRAPSKDYKTDDYDDADADSTASCSLSDIDTLSGVTTVVSSVSTASSADIDYYEEDDFDLPKNREILPIDDYREAILEDLSQKDILIISGHTGCGKSTQVPQFILESHARKKERVNIIVTQPRKIAAKTIAERVCKERGSQLGGTVGYHVGLDKVNKSKDTRLLFVTTGVLKMMLIGDSNLANNFTHIIIDEVHERELDTDFLLAFLKKQMMTTDTSYKLILMSATIQKKKFQEYFAEKINGEFVLAKHLNVGSENSGLTTNHKVNVMKLEKFDELKHAKYSLSEPKIHDEAIEACNRVIRALPKMDKRYRLDGNGAVLIFLPGIREIEHLENRLRTDLKDEHPALCFVRLHSSLSWEDQQRAFEDVQPNQRKVVLATNIAESSVTLKDIVYVLDFCLTKRLQKDPLTEYPQLSLCWASKQELLQRKGRVGRITRGTVFQLITEALFRQLDEEPVPEVLRVPLSKVVLEIKMCNFGAPKDFLAITMDPPEYEDIKGAVQKLKLISALRTTIDGKHSVDDGDLTLLGELIAKLPVDVQLGKLIVFGHLFGLLDNAIIIAAGLNGKSIFLTQSQHLVQSYKSKLEWARGTQSDFYAILYAYEAWEIQTSKGEKALARSKKTAVDFCRRYKLDHKQLNEMSDLVKEIKENLKHMNIETPVKEPKSKCLKDSSLLMELLVVCAFYPNYFYKFHNPEREPEANRTLLENDTMRSVYFLGLPMENAEHARLYYNQVNTYVESISGDGTVEDIKFEGQKIIVTFRQDARARENNIPVAAHALLKSCSTRRRLTLDLYDPQRAATFYKNLKKTETRVSSSSNGCLQIPQLPPPKMSQTKIDFMIISFNSPTSFWVLLRDDWDEYAQLHQTIEENIDDCPLADVANVKVGETYLLEYDGLFSRARIESTRPLAIFFIDHGSNYQETKQSPSLRIIPAKLQADLSVKAYAIECSMAGLQPNMLTNMSNESEWDEETCRTLTEMIKNDFETDSWSSGEIYADIRSRGGAGINKFIIKFTTVTFTNASGERIEIRDWLLSNKLAIPKTESYQVHQEAKKRLTFSEKHEAMQEHLDNPNRYVGEDPIKIKVEHKMSVERIELKGPFHTMKTRISGLTQSCGSKTVNIEPTSVNSLLLDNYPEAVNHHWMLAGNVSLGSKNETLLLRHTSWMPCFPGFGPLAILLFTPRVELRVTHDRTRLAGFLGGLGAKSSGKQSKTQSMYKEYDFEVEFDIRVGHDEILLVNKIRETLSSLLTRGPEEVPRMSQVNFLHQSREIMLSQLNILFNKEMKFKNREVPKDSKSLTWTTEEKLHGPEVPMFSKIEIPKSMRSVKDLWKEFKNSRSEPVKDAELYCPGCSKFIQHPHEKDLHFQTEQHNAAMDRLRKDNA